jgi:hypothetical protein
MRLSTNLIAAIVVMAPLAGCGSVNTKGSWSCPPDKGVACASISTIDGGVAPPAAARRGMERGEAQADGVGALRWWTANEAGAGSFDKAPRREPDQFAKVLIAGWIDASGDYHAPSEVYALMRRGSWWAAPPAVPLITAAASKKEKAPAAAVANVEAPPALELGASVAPDAPPKVLPSPAAATPGSE